MIECCITQLSVWWKTNKEISSYQTGPAGDANFGVQHCGEEDEEQQGEEEGRTAHKLEEVESTTGDAAVDHLLQDEGHEGQKLTEGERRQEHSVLFKPARCSMCPQPSGEKLLPTGQYNHNIISNIINVTNITPNIIIIIITNTNIINVTILSNWLNCSIQTNVSTQ